MTAERWPRDDFLQAIWDCPNLKANERLVAQAYGEFAKDGVEAWVVPAEMARRTGIKSRDAHGAARKGLVCAGWLVLVRRGRMHQTAVYRIAVPPNCEDDAHTALCTGDRHKRPGLLVTGKQAQALVTGKRQPLVTGKRQPLVTGKPSPSLQNHSNNQSARVREAVDYLAEHYGVTDGQTIYDEMSKHANGQVENPLGYARACVKKNPDQWRPAPAEDSYDPDCPDCPDGWIDEYDDDGKPIGIHPCHCRKQAP